VDQLESSTPGLVAQLKGRPTIKRYKAATVFVDHFSGLSYVHLQKSTSADETVEAKDCFERYAASQGVRILHYFADNGRFTCRSQPLPMRRSRPRIASSDMRRGVRILHYYADNGRFTDNQFRQAVADRRQTLPLCGVNTHFQNAIAGRKED
jgi:hypothetical protein